MEKALDTDQKVIRYEVDIFADGSDLQLMTKKELFEFAELQTGEWYEENILETTDEQGNTMEKYADARKLADRIVNENYNIQTISEVELLFSLPATTIPFEIVYV